MTILAGVVAYPIVGYALFRLWCLLSPPRYGRCAWKNEDHVSVTDEAWFVPGILLQPKEYVYEGERLPRGSGVVEVLWATVCLWPVILLVFGVVLSGYAIGHVMSRLAINATNAATRSVKVIPDPDLVEAHQEVEAILKDSLHLEDKETGR